VAILGQACFQLPDVLAQRLKERRLLRNLRRKRVLGLGFDAATAGLTLVSV